MPGRSRRPAGLAGIRLRERTCQRVGSPAKRVTNVSPIPRIGGPLSRVSAGQSPFFEPPVGIEPTTFSSRDGARVPRRSHSIPPPRPCSSFQGGPCRTTRAHPIATNPVTNVAPRSSRSPTASEVLSCRSTAQADSPHAPIYPLRSRDRNPARSRRTPDPVRRRTQFHRSVVSTRSPLPTLCPVRRQHGPKTRPATKFNELAPTDCGSDSRINSKGQDQ